MNKQMASLKKHFTCSIHVDKHVSHILGCPPSFAAIKGGGGGGDGKVSAWGAGCAATMLLVDRRIGHVMNTAGPCIRSHT